MALPHPKAVLFDLDGTLIDSLDDLTSAVNRTLKTYALSPVTPDVVRGRIGHGAAHLVSASVGPDIPLKEAMSTFQEAYAAVILDQTRVYPGLMSVLQRLEDLHIIRAVATNKPATWTNQIIRSLGLAERLNSWASGDECQRKPEPDVIQLALKRAQAEAISPQDIIYVGDMPVDVQTAQNFGCRCIGVAWGFDPTGLEAANPTLWADDAEALIRHLGI